MSNLNDAAYRRVDASFGEHRPSLEATIERFADLAALRRRWEQVEAMPVLAETRDDGVDQSWSNLDIRTLVRGEQSAGRFSAHSLKLPKGAGLPAHYQEDAHTFVLVVEGAVELGVGKLLEPAGQYTVASVPPRTRLSFRNTSDEPVTLTVVYSPAGVDRAFGAAHEHWKKTGDQDETAYREILARYGFRFDAQALENDDKTNVSIPPIELDIRDYGDLEALRAAFASRPALPRLVQTTAAEFATQEAGKTFRKEVVNGDETGGQGMINLLSGSPGFKAFPHYQPTEEEFFFVMDGLLEMTCATELRTLKAGGFAFCPRNCTHGFANPSSTGNTRFLTLNSPAGHERAMASIRRAVSQGGATKEQLHELSVIGGFIFHGMPELAGSEPGLRKS